MNNTEAPLKRALEATVLLAFLVLACAHPNRSLTTNTLTAEHRSAISAALRAKQLPSPQSLELSDGGFLVATYELRSTPPGSMRGFAEDALLAIREAMLPFKFVEAYRVTLNGPSPGSGLIRRYGSARFIEGGSVEWEPAR